MGSSRFRSSMGCERVEIVDLGDQMEQIVDMLESQYCLSGVVLIATERTDNQCEIRASRRGTFHECLGMVEDYRHNLKHKTSGI